MSEKTLINVRIGGVPYTIKTDEPGVNVERAAADVDRRIAAHQRDAEWLSSEKALALTAIELADRYLRLKDEVDNVNARYRETSKQLFYLQKETDELKQQLFLLQRGVKDEQPEEAEDEYVQDEPADEDVSRGYGYGGEVDSFV
ncbi:MAG: cell division protein ZapA [Clostridia bacterium]|nr:cell division protein ZapA [Clostridia bacterium]MBR4439546.1 cell division protein ZapA [Clostridia bacterium]